jgi:hypothetical protein
MTKRRAGNPILDLVRNTDVTKANIARASNADQFAFSVLKKIFDLGLFDQIDDKQKMVIELNKHGIKTRKGGKWSRVQYDRFYERFKKLEKSDEPILSNQ